MTTAKAKRKKRFERDTSTYCRLTERDREICKLIYQYRFLTSDQIITLIPGSRRGILRRLHLMFHSGYLDRPRAQLAWFDNRPMVYALGNKGAGFLAQELDLPLTTVDWTSKNREVKGIFLEHTLMVAQLGYPLRFLHNRAVGIFWHGSCSS